MNRLIIVGNGFDLAHGLKTTYKDFIFWYIADCLCISGSYPNKHEDNFIKVLPPELSYINPALNTFSKNPLHTKTTYLDFIYQLYNKNSLIKFLDISPENNFISREFETTGSFDATYFKVVIKNSFLGELIYSCIDCNWVDIEQKYFDTLKKYVDKGILENIENIKSLNSCLEYLKSKLEKYLKIQEKNIFQNDILNFARKISQNLKLPTLIQMMIKIN